MTPFIKKFITTTALVASGLTLGATLAFAQSNPMSLTIDGSSNVKLIGTVSAISAPTISVSSWLGTWSVNTANATFAPLDSETIADIHVGDAVAVSGTLGSGMTVNATEVADRSLEADAKAHVGTIQNLNVSAGTFSLTGKEGKILTVASTSNTKVFVDGSASLFANLANNMRVMVSGTLNNVTQTINANVIRAFHVGAEVNVHAKENEKGDDHGNFWGHILQLFRFKSDK